MSVGSISTAASGTLQMPHDGSAAQARSPVATQSAAMSSQCRRFSATWAGRSSEPPLMAAA